jgi:hypothetical protein
VQLLAYRTYVPFLFFRESFGFHCDKRKRTLTSIPRPKCSVSVYGTVRCVFRWGSDCTGLEKVQSVTQYRLYQGVLHCPNVITVSLCTSNCNFMTRIRRVRPYCGNFHKGHKGSRVSRVTCGSLTANYIQIWQEMRRMRIENHLRPWVQHGFHSGQFDCTYTCLNGVLQL